MTKIAVSYDNGQVFQHFGRTEQFKIYEVENGEIVASFIAGSEGQGHGALAGVLADKAVDVLICGGMGGGAQAALSEQGITVCSGVTGDADEAVAAFLRGELESAGINCNHHEQHEEEDCSCGGGCSSGGCGGGCGGCHGPQFTIEGKNVGKTCRVHYRGTLNDGTQFDSSYDRGEPLEFMCGVGMMIKGFDQAVANMEVGEKKDIHLSPEEAYGMPDPDAIFTVTFDDLPGADELEVGEQVVLQNVYGQPFQVMVTAKDDVSVTFDANHEMAGKELNFTVELVEIK